MPNPIVEQIQAELEKLSNELESLSSTASYLTGAKEIASLAKESLIEAEGHFKANTQELNKSLTKLTDFKAELDNLISKINAVDFPERLTSIENNVQETINFFEQTKNQTLNELKKASTAIEKADFEGKFSKLSDEINKSVKANQEILDSLEKQNLPNKITNLQKETSQSLDKSLIDFKKETEDLKEKIFADFISLNITGTIDILTTKVSDLKKEISALIKTQKEVETNLLVKSHELSNIITTKIDAFQLEVQKTNKKQEKMFYITWGIVVIGIIIFALI
jgi:membrane-bound lytic murein transglycosylase